MTCRVWPAQPGWTAGRRTSPSGSAPATSPSSTTRTWTGSAPTRCIRRHVAAVVNVAPSISGRYPNHGPQLLLEAGIPLVDDAGPDLFAKVREGKIVRLNGETLYAGEEVIAKGRLQTAESVAAAMAEAKASVAAQLQAFVTNTLEYMTREGDLLHRRHRRARAADPDGGQARPRGGQGLPPPGGPGHAALLHPRVQAAHDRRGRRRRRPARGRVPARHHRRRHGLGVGRRAACGAELVVHAYPDGRAPGLARVSGSACRRCCCPARGPARTSRCCMADEKGASLIVAVGTHDTPGRVPRQGPAGVLEHLPDPAAGGRRKLVDAKGVSRLYRPPGVRLGADGARARGRCHYPGGHGRIARRARSC